MKKKRSAPYANRSVHTVARNKRERAAILKGLSEFYSVTDRDKDFMTIAVDPWDFDAARTCHQPPTGSYELSPLDMLSHLKEGRGVNIPGVAEYNSEVRDGTVAIGCHEGTFLQVEEVYDACVRARRAKRPPKSSFAFGITRRVTVTSAGTVVSGWRKVPFSEVEGVYKHMKETIKKNK